MPAVVALVIALSACGGGEPDRAGDGTTSSSTTERATTEDPTTTERDPTVTMGPDCTVGTIPEGREVPPGCDRLYSPFLGPGQDCIEGQSPDCIDPDRDGRFTFVLAGGRCLVERKAYDRCRDEDGDGILDDPLTG